MIRKFNYKTPGREDEGEETKLYTRKDVETAKQEGAQSALIVKGLGGRDNIADIDCCATRLRITVKDGGKVSDELLKQSGASGVIHKGNGVQVIYGPTVTVVKSNLEDYLDMHVDVQTGVCMLGAFADGRVVDLKSVEDEVFSQGILGQGIAIEPTKGVIYAPCDGTVSNLVDTKHAIGLKTAEGFEILIHVGIDTVNLKGKHFEYAVSSGDAVRKGDVLLRFDKAAIEKAGYKTVTPLVIADASGYKGLNVVAVGDIKHGEELLEILY